MAAPIIVPLDGSAFSEQALPTAANLARRSGSPLHLVRVHVLTIPVAYPEATVFFSAELEKRARDSEREYLDTIASRFTDHDVRTALIEGSIVNALETYIAETGAELVVMTTHGRSGLSRAWLGSIADSVVRHVEVPVLLRRPNADQEAPLADGFSHLLIPLDGSVASESILAPATRIGRLTRARYTLLQVVPPADELATAEAVASVILTDETVHRIKLESTEYLERTARRLQAEGHEVDTRILVHRQPATGILDEATRLHADLVAMATHGYSGIQRIALGSVADKVLRGTHLPILMLRPPQGALAQGRSVA